MIVNQNLHNKHGLEQMTSFEFSSAVGLTTQPNLINTNCRALFFSNSLKNKAYITKKNYIFPPSIIRQQLVEF